MGVHFFEGTLTAESVAAFGRRLHEALGLLLMTAALSTKFVTVGWSLFLVCLALPATVENESAVYGYQYAKISIEMIFSEYDGWPYVAISGIGNVLAGLGIFVFLSKSRVLPLFLAFVFVMFGANNGWYSFGGMEDLAVGYFVWVASYFLMALGFLCLLVRRLNKSAQPDALTRAAGLKRCAHNRFT